MNFVSSIRELKGNALKVSLLGSLTLMLAGCSANFGDVALSGPQQTDGGAIALRGSIHGGQQPISGATIQLYAAGTSGYGSAAAPILTSTVATDANGGFSISGDYTCPAGGLIYLTAAAAILAWARATRTQRSR
jgi:trimeric autotransporter adhesin